MPPKDNSFWARFRDGALPSLFSGMCLTVVGSLFAMWLQVQKSEDRFVKIEKEQAELRAKFGEMATQREVLERIDALGLKIENVLLRAGVKPGRIGKE